MTMTTTVRLPVKVPDLGTLKATELREAAATLERLRADSRETSRRLVELQDQRPGVEQAQRRRQADALLSGGVPYDGPVAVVRHDAEIAAHIERRAALRVAVTEAERRVGDVLARAGGEYLSQARQAVDSARSEALGALDELVAARGRLDDATWLVSWLSSFPGRVKRSHDSELDAAFSRIARHLGADAEPLREPEPELEAG
jgi:hypothetical protein